jgi:two-component system phosphate regulon sensor histidine kinase PhoR
MISRRTFRVFIVLAALSFVGVLLTQIIWMKKAYYQKKDEFNRQLTIALQEVVRDVLKYNNTFTMPPNPVNQLTENYYAVMVNDLIDPSVLDHFIRQEFNKFHISESYAYSIYDCSNKQLVYGGYYSENLKEESANSFKFPAVKLDNNYFTIYFPNIKMDLFSDMGLWIYLSLLVLLILIFFTYSFFVITRQKRMSEVQRDFINNMAHEIRTPLTTIGISADGIESNVNKNNEKVVIFANIIKEEAVRMKLQLEKILGLEEGIKLKNDWVDPNKVIFDCAQKIQLLNNLVDDQFTLNLIKEPIHVFVDPFHFSQVCSNLIENAIKYSPTEIQISLSTYISNGKFVLCVQDKGLGIAPKYQKQIFHRFFRVPYGNIHQVKGFGIGLFYVKQIAKAQGGQVRLESALGLGSKFFIELPKFKYV